MIDLREEEAEEVEESISIQKMEVTRKMLVIRLDCKDGRRQESGAANIMEGK
jgi:hypothetical protein